MRIVAGKYKNHIINANKRSTTSKFELRPTKSKVRAAVFNILNSILDFDNVSVLDLYCGTGAFGLESLSRGAKHATFIDINHHNIESLKSSASRMKIQEDIYYLCADARKLDVLAGARQKYDIIYIDPPYGSILYIQQTIDSVLGHKLLNNGGLFVIETECKQDIHIPEGIEAFDVRKYGCTKILFCKLSN